MPRSYTKDSYLCLSTHDVSENTEDSVKIETENRFQAVYATMLHKQRDLPVIQTIDR
jgi:hypothetical protein